MTLTLDTVLRLASLARLEISAGEAEAVRAKLEGILELVDTLQAIPTEGVEPMAHALDIAAPLREDVVTEADAHALFQSVAPAVEDAMYLVPRVIE
jgi:aspartyl-tRNA(Asn)/glutamyl-tRNA(Gln) amidotransferase subunit C